MKTCPKCNATYTDELTFCLQDGVALADSQTQISGQNTDPAYPRPTTENDTSASTLIFDGVDLPGNDPSKNKGFPFFRVLVGLFALALLLIFSAAAAFGVWWYMQSRQTDQTPKVTEKRDKKIGEVTPKTETEKPAKKSGGITKENFEKLKTGMSYAEVVEIFGEEGDEISSTEAAGQKFSTYMWKSGTFTNVTLTFRNDKLMSKFQIGLK